MATLFMEPGGDATFDGKLWNTFTGTAAIVSDIVHGGHVKSIQPGTTAGLARATVSSSSGRNSCYIRLTALPTNATATIITIYRNGSTASLSVRLTSAGVLRLYDETLGQIGSNGSTLSTGVWYRLTWCWNMTSTTVNEFRLYKDHVSDISVSNATISFTSVASIRIGNKDSDATLDFRLSDIYCDDSSSASDIATDVWVTAKRPNANGSANNFSTQIGAGGSGYGSGHSPQVNERALSTTNGWSMVGAGSAVTEEYSVEAAATGDIDISAATLIDYTGWVYASSLAGETASIIVGGTSSSIALSGSNLAFLAVKGSTSYPGGGTDIGIITDTSLTTVSLYECGLMFAYTPALVTLLPLPGMNTSFQN